ncbi:MAG: peptide-methionine (S)-S-oxide reductase MsrA [Xanthomonadales bacterium]|nr:peptide-methionine (S)-S-oxide reductase MsrA [Xanthomonadales bacterium]
MIRQLRVLLLGGLMCLPAAQLLADDQTAKATFAGGCFWCVEADFDKVDGVLSTTSGFIGGQTVNPSYEQVVSGRTGHTEAVEIVYDPGVVSFEQLLQVFWLNIDPTVSNRQFCDTGSQYRTGIFFHDQEQQRLAQASSEAVAERWGFDVKTEIEAAGPFYPAEKYHQDYYLKNPIRYRYYRTGCGRDRRLRQLYDGADQAFELSTASS